MNMHNKETRVADHFDDDLANRLFAQLDKQLEQANEELKSPYSRDQLKTTLTGSTEEEAA